jgi:hypothetical protein
MSIEPWRAAAYEVLPTFRDLVERAEDVSMLWIELSDLKIEMEESPLSDDEISSLFRFASWCLSSRDEKCQNVAIIEFWERLPVIARIRSQLHKHLSVDDFNGLKEIFEYNLSKEEHEKFVEEFMGNASQRKESVDMDEA